MEEIHEEIKEAIKGLETYKNRYRTVSTQDVIDMLKRLNESVKLTIPVVGQQRELLENFADWMDKNINFDGIRQEEIESYITEKIL